LSTDNTLTDDFFKWLQQRRDIHLRILNLESSMNHHQQLLPSGAAW
jgi:hypothetical protein